MFYHWWSERSPSTVYESSGVFSSVGLPFGKRLPRPQKDVHPFYAGTGLLSKRWLYGWRVDRDRHRRPYRSYFFSGVLHPKITVQLLRDKFSRRKTLLATDTQPVPREVVRLRGVERVFNKGKVSIPSLRFASFI